MKLLVLFLLLISFYQNMYAWYEFYKQQVEISLYATDQEAKNSIEAMFAVFNLSYDIIDSFDDLDDQKLYIMAGNISDISPIVMPKQYIIYQTEVVNLTQSYINLLSGALVVWDAHWFNINRYRDKISHWYYLPDEHYEFLDPVLLSCLLPATALSTYKELLQHSNVRNTDFSSHLPVLFCHCFLQNPDIFIESGIRWGDGSTIALGKISTLLHAQLIGLDIDNCAHHYAHIPHARFFQGDDVAFPAYFKTLNFAKDTVDFVFIDTSHQYEHTLQEIDAFTSILADNGTISFHDSNVAVEHPVRINGTACGSGLGNPKGVTDGLKTYFDIAFDEGKYLNVMIEKDGYLWNLVNYPYCYGLAVAKRVKRVLS